MIEGSLPPCLETCLQNVSKNERALGNRVVHTQGTCSLPQFQCQAFNPQRKTFNPQITHSTRQSSLCRRLVNTPRVCTVVLKPTKHVSQEEALIARTTEWFSDCKMSVNHSSSPARTQHIPQTPLAPGTQCVFPFGCCTRTANSSSERIMFSDNGHPQ